MDREIFVEPRIQKVLSTTSKPIFSNIRRDAWLSSITQADTSWPFRAISFEITLHNTVPSPNPLLFSDTCSTPIGPPLSLEIHLDLINAM